MSWHRRGVLSGLAVGLLPTAVFGGDLAAQVRQVVEKRARDERLRSVVFGVWQESEELLALALGQSRTGQPADTAMHYRTGAITTAYLGGLLLHLADRGRLQLTDPVSNWLPDLPRSRQVTLEMLSLNRSGYADFLASPPFQSGERRWLLRNWNPAELIKLGTRLPMIFNPGTGFHCSHTNAVILGEALIGATGTPIAQLMRDVFINPLELTDTAYPHGSELRRPILRAFSREFSPYEESTWWNPAWVSHSGAMTSNLRDVARWARLLGSGAILSKTAYAQLTAPTNVGDNGSTPDLYFGMGVIVANGWIVQNALYFGWNPVMAYLPSRRITISLNSVRGPGPEPDSSHSLRILKDVVSILTPDHQIPDRFR